MTAAPRLWIVFTLVAAGAQTVRNATQRQLTGPLGAAGATHVRFLFGLPFALLFLIAVLAAGGFDLPRPPAPFWIWVLLGERFTWIHALGAALIGAGMLVASLRGPTPPAPRPPAGPAG